MKDRLSLLSGFIFGLIALCHLWSSPCTKVEESFNIQAIHDFLEYGFPVANATAKIEQQFDHSTFPGAVPRTFVGSIVISGLAGPAVWFFALTGSAAQTYARALLGLANASALAIFASSVNQAYGPITAGWYVILQASQFHVWYYASRTLPNMFSFCFSTLALAFLLPKTTPALARTRNIRLGMYLITIATVIFRAELGLLLGAHCVWLLLKPHTLDAKFTLIRKTLLPSIVPGAILALLVTVSVDTHMWCSSQWLWPEFAGFLSNVFPTDGKGGASEWGVQPFHWYLTAALPRLLMSQIILIGMTLFSSSARQDVRVLDSLVPSCIYISLYSLLPHKESRFIFPVIPSLTLVAALNCARFTINMDKTRFGRPLMHLVVLSTVIMALVSHTVLLPLSALNYPGGQALQSLHRYYAANWHSLTETHGSGVHVHLTNLALQTGVTRFLEQPTTMNMTGLILGPAIIERADDHVKVEPLVLAGDADHPALTIHPSPLSTTVAKLANNLTPRWVYDKTSKEERFLEPAFWDKFNFVIVEQPHLAIGAWEIIDTIEAVGRPQLLRSESFCSLRYGEEAHEQMGKQDTEALLHAMYPKAIAYSVSQIYNILHDVFRCGRWLPVKLGYWIEVPLETKLHVLRKSSTGTKPNDSAETEVFKNNKEDAVPGLPQEAATDQIPLDFGHLGPLVVNKDGTLSRLDNWAQMNKQERKKTIDYLKKRNLIRMEAAPS